MPDDLIPFDVAAHLTEPEDQAGLIADAVATGDAGTIAKALGIVARARGMSSVGAEVGMNRQQLYRTLSDEGNPTLATMLRVLKALDLELRIEPAQAA